MSTILRFIVSYLQVVHAFAIFRILLRAFLQEDGGFQVSKYGKYLKLSGSSFSLSLLTRLLVLVVSEGFSVSISLFGALLSLLPKDGVMMGGEGGGYGFVLGVSITDNLHSTSKMPH